MNMRVFRKGQKKGEWRLLTWGGVTSAVIKCPLCGFDGRLTSHTIKQNGDVNPSVVCPNEDCSFHEYITLEGWKKCHKKI